MAETEMKIATTLLVLVQQDLNATSKTFQRCPAWRARGIKSMLPRSHSSLRNMMPQAKPAVTDPGDPSRNQLSSVRRKGVLLSTLYLVVDFPKVATAGLLWAWVLLSLGLKRLSWQLGITRLQLPSGVAHYSPPRPLFGCRGGAWQGMSM